MGEKKKPRVNMTMRLRVLTALFLVIGFGLVGVRLLYMQVFHHDFYIQKATSLQTRDTFITPNRGKIYDANMQVLAESAEVERITVSPKAVVSETKEKNGVTADVQRQTLATILSETLDVSYDSVMEKLNKTDSEYEIIAQKVDKDVTKELNAKLEAAGCTADMSNEEICDALVSAMTSLKFTGLTGTDMTWNAEGQVSKAPTAYVVKDGQYVKG